MKGTSNADDVCPSPFVLPPRANGSGMHSLRRMLAWSGLSGAEAAALTDQVGGHGRSSVRRAGSRRGDASALLASADRAAALEA